MIRKRIKNFKIISNIGKAKSRKLIKKKTTILTRYWIYMTHIEAKDKVSSVGERKTSNVSQRKTCNMGHITTNSNMMTRCI